MTILTSINEATTSYVSASFKNAAGALEAPSSVVYRIDCLTNKQQILDWTATSAASSITITVSALQNAIINQRHPSEQRYITIKATYAGSEQVTEEYHYEVVNLNFLT